MLLTLAASWPAWAHDERPPQGRDPLFDDGELVAAVTSWGLVTRAATGWERVCDEALLHQEVFWWVRPDGRIGTATEDGLRETDVGCVFSEPAVSFAGRRFVAGTRVDGSIWLAAATPGGTGGVVRSLDGGGTFADLSFPDPDAQLNRVVAVPGGEVWVSGTVPGTTDVVAYRSPDGGDTWEELDTSALTGWIVPWVAGVDTDGTGLVWAALDDAGGGVVLRSDASLSSVEVVAVTAQPVTGYAAFGGARWLVLNQSALVRQIPGGELEDVLPNGVVTVPCASAPGDGALWACVSGDEGAHFLRTEDGRSWAPVLDPAAVAERVCGEDDVPTFACDHEAPDFLDELLEPPEDPGGCGCRAASGAAWLWMLLPLSVRRSAR